MRKKILMTVGILLVLSSPWLIHLFSKTKSIEVAVVDVSSKDNNYAERQGIYDALYLNKIVKENGERYKVDRDFYGVKVVEARNSVLLNELPLRIDQTDLIYLTDLHGIKENEISWGDQDSEKILYGGLSGNDWRVIKTRLSMNVPSTLIVEYNSFSKTTESKVATELADSLGIEHTNFHAKYFDDLSESNIEGVLKGSGLVIENKLTNDRIVLKSAKPVQFTATKLGKEKFGFGNFEPFDGWFDLVIEKDADVLANYELDVSSDDAKLLEQFNLPRQFAIITQTKRSVSTQYFFAGKFSEKKKATPAIFNMAGYKTLAKLFSKEDAFYWHHFIPIFDQILFETEHVERPKIASVSVEPVMERGVSYNARITGDYYEVLQDGKWKEIIIKGINIGMAKPGAFPGDAAITKEEYQSWLQSIGELGANAIRVYIIHPPAFYEALLEYNESHEQPIYLFHGIWIEEEAIEENLDVNGEPTEKFQEEIIKTIDVIHGNATIVPEKGHASGQYTANVAPYLIGWIHGVEWSPIAIDAMNKKYRGKKDFEGKYFSTKDAQPFEIWMAKQFEFTAQYEIEKYKWMHPFSFTNWPTTDILEHPYEEFAQEDLVAIDPNVIYEQDILTNVGQFASYHIYPYYPNFINQTTPQYGSYIDHRGQQNNYAGYLNALKASHRLPILAAEFGIPSSRGLAYMNDNGNNQGHHTEKEQGEILVNLYEDLLQEKYIGGIVFSWQDEWFKKTWNTQDLDNPDQRPFWSNAQNSEANYGLLSLDRLKMKVDGDTSDWFGGRPFYENSDMKLFVDSDERFLYLRLDVTNTDFSETYYPLIYFDTLKNQGNRSYGEFDLLGDAEFVLSLKGENMTRLEVDGYYNLLPKIYSNEVDLLPVAGTNQKNSSIFNPIYSINGRSKPVVYVLKDGEVVPVTTNETSFKVKEAGKLRQGNGNPESTNYDSLADFAVNEEDGVVEIRIPWMLLNFTDPSRLEVWSDIYANKELKREIIDGIGIGSMLVKDETVLSQLPESELHTYMWQGWDQPETKQRLKDSYYTLQKKFFEIQ